MYGFSFTAPSIINNLKRISAWGHSVISIMTGSLQTIVSQVLAFWFKRFIVTVHSWKYNDEPEYWWGNRVYPVAMTADVKKNIISSWLEILNKRTTNALYLLDNNGQV